MIKKWTFLIVSIALLIGLEANTNTKPIFSDDAQVSFGFGSAPDARIDLQREEVYINEDQTYVMTLTQETTLLSHNGILSNQSLSSPSYYPGYNEVKLLEAYLIQPDGTKVEVPKSNVFTTTSPANPAIPGFDTSLVQSVAFPQLTLGSKLHVKWEYKQIKTPDFRFADTISPSFNTDTMHTEMSVNVPESMYIRWAKEGNFEVREAREDGRYIVSAVLGPHPAKNREPFMPADADLLPFFEVSTIPSWEEIGNTISQLTTANQEITPEIEALAKKIVGDKKGKEAARALYDWTANNVFYLNVVLDPRQGIAPPPVSQILFNRFGDCKGHSSVLQTLLKAIGIESYPVLVNWDNSLKQYPLPIPNFDHEMLFIPSLNLFANPTDLYNPFGAPLEETNFSSQGLQVLSGKPVMIAKPKQSVLTQTPEAKAEQNQYKILSKMKMDLQGNMQGIGLFETTGCFDNLMRAFLAESGSATELVSSLVLSNGINGQAEGSAPSPNNLDASMKMKFAWEGEKVAQLSEGELLFQVPYAVDIFPPLSFIRYLSPNGSRQYPLIIGSGIYEWEHTLELPPDYIVRKRPIDVNISNLAGSYGSMYKEEQGKLYIHRKLILQKNVYPAEEYPHVEMLLIQLVQDSYSIFSLSPQPIKDFPGIQNQK